MAHPFFIALLQATSVSMALVIFSIIVWWVVTVVVCQFDRDLKDLKIMQTNKVFTIGGLAFTNASESAGQVVRNGTKMVSKVGKRYFTGPGAWGRLIFLLGGLFLVWIALYHHDSAISFADRQYKCKILPAAETFFMPFQNYVRMMYDMTMGAGITAARMAGFYNGGWLKILITCPLSGIRDMFLAVGSFSSNFFNSYVNWQSDPLKNEFDGRAPARDFARMVRSFHPILTCLCKRLEPVWDAITNIFMHEPFYDAVHYLINSLLELFQMITTTIADIFGRKRNYDRWNTSRADPEYPDDYISDGKEDDGRPNFTHTTDTLCDFAGSAGKWVDAVVQDNVDGIIILFSGKPFTIPPLGCIISHPICGVSAILEVTLNSIVRADRLVDPDVSEKYLKFDKAESWFDRWSACLGNVFPQASLACGIKNFVRAFTSFTFGLIRTVVQIGLDIKRGLDMEVIIDHLWTTGKIDVSLAYFDTSADCFGDYFSTWFGPLGCIVRYNMRIFASCIRLLVTFGETMTSGLKKGSFGSKLVAQTFVETWDKGGFNETLVLFQGLSRCITQTMDDLYPGVGCVFASAVDTTINTVMALFRIGYLGAKTVATGESYASLLYKDWNSGQFYPPFSSLLGLGDCLDKVVREFPPLAGLLRSIVRVPVFFAISVFQTINIITEGLATDTDMAIIFISYWDAGVYDGFHEEMKGLSVSLANLMAYFYDDIGCLGSSIVMFVADLLKSLMEIAVSIMRGVITETPIEEHMRQQWIKNDSAYKGVLSDLMIFASCLGTFVSAVAYIPLGNILADLLLVPLVFLRDLFQSAALYVQGKTEKTTPGHFFFERWYSDELQSANIYMKKLGDDLEIVPEAISVKFLVYLACESLYFILDIMVIGAQSVAEKTNFGALLLQRWDEGRFDSFKNVLELFCQYMAFAISSFDLDVFQVVSSLGIAAARIVINFMEIIMCIVRAVVEKTKYREAYGESEMRDVWGPLYNASVHIGVLCTRIHPRFGSIMETTLFLGISSARFVVHFVNDVIVAAASATFAVDYVYRDYKAGGFEYLMIDIENFGIELSGIFELFWEEGGCIVRNTLRIVVQALRILIETIYMIEASARTETDFLNTFSALYMDYARSPGESIFDMIAGYGACTYRLDEILDPEQKCATSSLFELAGAAGDSVYKLTMPIQAAILDGAAAGGIELEYQWYENNLNKTLVSLDRVTQCVGGIGFTYFFPQAGCIVPTTAHIATSLLFDAMEFAVLLEKTLRLEGNMQDSFDDALRSGQIGAFNRAVYDFADCMGSLSTMADGGFGCFISSLMKFSDVLLLSVVKFAVQISRAATDDSSFGSVFTSNWEQQEYQELFDEWYNVSSCAGKMLARGSILYGESLHQILNLPLTFLNDFVELAITIFFVVKNENAFFGDTMQAKWKRGVGNMFIQNLFDLSGAVRPAFSQITPALGCFISVSISIVASTIQTVTQVVMDATKSRRSFSEEFILSWLNGRYDVQAQWPADIATCIFELLGIIDVNLACFTTNLLAIVPALLQDIVQFGVMLIFVITDKMSFKDAFAHFWNTGLLAHGAISIFSAGKCLGLLVREQNLSNYTGSLYVDPMEVFFPMSSTKAPTITPPTITPPTVPPPTRSPSRSTSTTGYTTSPPTPSPYHISGNVGFRAERPQDTSGGSGATSKKNEKASETHAEWSPNTWWKENVKTMPHPFSTLKNTRGMGEDIAWYALGTVGCYPATILRFTGTLIIAIFQGIVDIFCTEQFEENWDRGNYNLVTETSYDLFRCFTASWSELDSSTGCLLQSLLELAGEFSRDFVVFCLAWSRSTNYGTNFGKELLYVIETGKMNSTYSTLETVAYCTENLGGTNYACLLSTTIKIANRILSAFFLFLAQAISSDDGPYSFYRVSRKNWDAGLFEPTFEAIDQLADCVGGLLNKAYPQLGCFVSSPLRFVNRVIKFAFQMGFDVMDPSGSQGFDQAWYSGKYSALFTSEQIMFMCIADPLTHLDEGVSCAVFGVFNYAVALVTDTIDFILAFKTAINVPMNFGYALQDALNHGRMNATYANTMGLADCLSEIGGSYLGGAGCLVGSLFVLVNYVARAGLQFFIDAAVSVGGGETFSSLFSRHWNEGKYNPISDGIVVVANCLKSVVANIDPRVGCIPANLLIFVAEVLRAFIQMALDVFVTDTFDENWNAGTYQRLWDSEEALFACFGEIVGLMNAPSHCLPTLLLNYMSTLFRDTVDMCLLFKQSVQTGANFGMLLNRATDLGKINATFANTDRLASCAQTVFGQDAPALGLVVGSGIRIFNALSFWLMTLIADFVEGSYEGSYIQVFGRDWQNGKLQRPFDTLDDFGHSLGALMTELSPYYACFYEKIVLLVSQSLRSVGFFLHDLIVSKNLPASWEGSGPGMGTYDPLFDRFDALLGCITSLLGLADSSLGCFTQHIVQYVTALVKDAADFIFCIYRAAKDGRNFGLELRNAMSLGRLKFTYQNTLDLAQCLDGLTSWISPQLGCALASILRVVGAFMFSIVNLVADVSIGSQPDLTGMDLPHVFANSWKTGVYAKFFDEIDRAGDCLAGFLGYISPKIGCFAAASVRLISGFLQMLVQMTLDVTVTDTFETEWNAGAYDTFFAREEALFACVGGIVSIANEDLGCVATNSLSYLYTFFTDAVDMVLAFRSSVEHGTNFGSTIDHSLQIGRLNATYENTEKLAECAGKFVGSMYEPMGCAVRNVIRLVNAILRAFLHVFIQTLEGSSSGYAFRMAVVNRWDQGAFDPIFKTLDELAICLGDFVSGIRPELSCIPRSAFMMLTGAIKVICQWGVDTFARLNFASQWRSNKYTEYTDRFDMSAACISGIIALANDDLGCVFNATARFLPALATDLVDAYLVFVEAVTGERNLGSNIKETLDSGRLMAVYNNTDRFAVCLGKLGAEISPPVGCIAENIPRFFSAVGMSLLRLTLDISEGVDAGDFAAIYRASWESGAYDPPLDSLKNLGGCAGDFMATFTPALRCPITTLTSFAVEIFRSVIQWSLDTFSSGNKFPENWLAGKYDGVFQAERAFFACLGTLVDFMDLGCFVSEILGLLASVFQDVVDWIVAAQMADEQGRNLGTVLKELMDQGRIKNLQTSQRNIGECAAQFLDHIDPYLGNVAAAVANFTSDLGTAGLILGSNLFQGFGSGGYTAFLAVLRESWESGDYSFFYDDIDNLGIALGAFLGNIAGDRAACFGTSSVSVFAGVIRAICQFSVDVLVGGDFKTSWESGKYSSLTDPLDDLSWCIANLASWINPGISCALHAAFTAFLAIAKDIVGLVLIIQASVENGGDLGAAINQALDTGSLTNVADLVGEVGRCISEVQDDFSEQIACITRWTFLAFRHWLLAGLRMSAVLLSAPMDPKGLYGTFDKAWTAGSFDCALYSLEALGNCFASILATFSEDLACIAGKIVPILVGFFRDTVEFLLASSRAAYGDGNLFGEIQTSWEQGRMDRAYNAVQDLILCVSTFLDKGWLGSGDLVGYVVLAVMDYGRNLIDAAIIIAANDMNPVLFGDSINAKWHSNLYEKPHQDLEVASAGLKVMLNPISPFVGCLGAAITIDFINAILRDLTSLAVIAVGACSQGSAEFISSILSGIQDSITNVNGKDLNMLYRLFHDSIPGCMMQADSILQTHLACLPANLLGFAASFVRNIGLLIVVTATSISGAGNNFCLQWESAAFDAVFRDWDALAMCVSVLLDDATGKALALQAIVFPILTIIPKIFKDLGNVFCIFASSSNIEDFSKRLLNQFYAGKLNNAANTFYTAAGSVSLTQIGRFPVLGCILIQGFMLLHGILLEGTHIIVIVVSGNAPYGTAGLTPTDQYPSSADNFAGRIILRLNDAWSYGRFQVSIVALVNLVTCFAEAVSTVSPPFSAVLRQTAALATWTLFLMGDALSVVTKTFVGRGNPAAQLLELWNNGYNMRQWSSILDALMVSLQTFIASITAPALGCVVVTPLQAIRYTIGACIQLGMEIMKMIAVPGTNLATEFSTDYLNRKFAGPFNAVDAIGVCLGNIAGGIHPALGQTIPPLLATFTAMVKSCITFFIYVIRNNATPRDFSNAMMAGLNDPSSEFVNPIFNNAVLVARGLGSFVNSVQPLFGALVTAVLSFIINTVRNMVRFAIIMGAGTLAGNDPLTTFSNDWMPNIAAYDGGNYNTAFNNYFDIATAAGSLFSKIHPAIGCAVSNVLSLPMHIIMFAITLVAFLTKGLGLGSYQGFNLRLWNPLLAVANCVGDFFSIVDPSLGCLARTTLSWIIQLARYLVQVMLTITLMVVYKFGLGIFTADPAPFRAATIDVVFCASNFVKRFDANSCSDTNTFICRSADGVYYILMALAQIMFKLIIEVPDGVFKAQIGTILDMSSIIAAVSGTFSSFSYAVASLTPPPNSNRCDKSSWTTALGGLFFNAFSVLLVPPKIVNMFLVNTFLTPSTSISQFLNSLMQIFIEPLVGALDSLASVLNCTSGAGAFFSRIATLLRQLLNVLSQAAINIIVDLIRIVVDMFTGNFKDFVDAILSLLKNFGNFFLAFAKTIFDAIIPGSVLQSIIDFFTGPACKAMETVVNAMVDMVNVVIEAVRCLKCGIDTNSVCQSCSGPCNENGCSLGQCGRAGGCEKRVTTSKCKTCDGLAPVSKVSMCPGSKRSTEEKEEPLWLREMKRRVEEGFARTEMERKYARTYDNEGYGNETVVYVNATEYLELYGAFEAPSVTYTHDIMDNMFYTPDTYDSLYESLVNKTYLFAENRTWSEEDMLRIVASLLPWEGESRCDLMVRHYNDSDWSTIPVGDRTFLAECVQKRAFTMKLGEAIGWLEIPQDIMYNWMRPYTVAKDVAMGLVIYAKCFSDNATCATEMKNFTAQLKGLDIDPRSVIFIMGLGQKVMLQAMNVTVLQSLAYSMGAQTGLGALMFDLSTFFAGAKDAIANATDSIDLSAALEEDLSTLAYIYNNTLESNVSLTENAYEEVQQGVRNMRNAGRYRRRSEPIEFSDRTAVQELYDEVYENTMHNVGQISSRGAEFVNEFAHPEHGIFVRLARNIFVDNNETWGEDGRPLRNLMLPDWMPHISDRRRTLLPESWSFSISTAWNLFYSPWTTAFETAKMVWYDETGAIRTSVMDFLGKIKEDMTPMSIPTYSARVHIPRITRNITLPIEARMDLLRAKVGDSIAQTIREVEMTAIRAMETTEIRITKALENMERTVNALAIVKERRTSQHFDNRTVPISFRGTPSFRVPLVHPLPSALRRTSISYHTTPTFTNMSMTIMGIARAITHPRATIVRFTGQISAQVTILPNNRSKNAVSDHKRARALHDALLERSERQFLPPVCKDNVCLDCLLADSLISLSIDCMKKSAMYYTTVYPKMVLSYTDFTTSMEDRRLVNATLHTKYPEYPTEQLTYVYDTYLKGALNPSVNVSTEPEHVDREYSLMLILVYGINDLFPGIKRWTEAQIDRIKTSSSDPKGSKVYEKVETLALSVLTCDTENLYTCERRFMSAGSGLLLVGSVFAGVCAVFYITQYSMAMVVAIGIVPFYYLFLYATYGSSPLCVVPPACLADDLIELVRDVIFVPCSSWLGLMVPARFISYGYETDYDNDPVCSNCDSRTKVVNCAEDLGFTDVTHTILFFMRWFNRDYFDLTANMSFPLHIITGSKYFQSARNRFLMTPNSSYARDPEVHNYVESEFTRNGSHIPQVYKTCGVLSLMNVYSVLEILAFTGVVLSALGAVILLVWILAMLLFNILRVSIVMISTISAYMRYHTTSDPTLYYDIPKNLPPLSPTTYSSPLKKSTAFEVVKRPTLSKRRSTRKTPSTPPMPSIAKLYDADPLLSKSESEEEPVKMRRSKRDINGNVTMMYDDSILPRTYL